MIDNKYWEKVAKEWKKEDDGIILPGGRDRGASSIIVDDNDVSVSEIDDILADLGIDDI